ncbi:nebulette isoform X6 [Pseudophryne corroboree]|uniref:nebulette isoform X6 n=1 Tax=Pseudophryne corroboree TaxID=495146 RepID=UPI0030820F1C
MNPQCGRCGKVVYPTEKVNCLDKYWHKGCFHCEVCKMTLNMNNYKGYDKKPYCNAHYPKQSFTTVADTPENLRLKQQSELQSQVKYKRDFEESKGRGFSIVTDTPELQRLKKTQEQISNMKYHSSFAKTRSNPKHGRGTEPKTKTQNPKNFRRSSLEEEETHIPTGTPTYKQREQQPVNQSFGGKREKAAPVSLRRAQPGGGGRTYRAMYDYSAQDEDEVSFRDGDYIVNVQSIDEGWMYGTVQRSGKSGMLPANYIEPVN